MLSTSIPTYESFRKHVGLYAKVSSAIFYCHFLLINCFDLRDQPKNKLQSYLKVLRYIKGIKCSFNSFALKPPIFPIFANLFFVKKIKKSHINIFL
uniref:Uncharacterized protein n=1 Tax=Lepeophtheirus salmonis TaxID=72036 RepID=A0A0K2T5S9_LEPSM